MVFPGSLSCIAMVSSNLDARLAFWAAAGAAAGVYLFIRGFLMLRYKRMIQNTPTSKIRSASMGLVELSGLAEGEQTIPAGITGQACYYYRAIAWQLKESGRSRSWKKVADESLYVPFFINDTTGRMLVDATGADMEVTRNFRDEFNASLFGNRDMLPENVVKFLARNGVLGGDTVRLEERCVRPGYPLFVFGTLESRPASGTAGWAVKPHASGTSVGVAVDMTVSGLSEQLGSNVTRMLGKIPGIQAQQKGASTGSALAAAAIANRARPGAGAGTAQATPAGAWSSVSFDEVSMAHREPASKAGTAVAEAPAQVERATTSGEFPPPAANLSAAIGKGADDAPFMISSQSQREVVRALGWKAALCIWGGPILALISMYYLLMYFRLT